MGIATTLIIYVALFLVIRQSVFIIGENQRGVIVRLGRFERIHYPGLLIVVPFMDRVHKIDLPAQVPGWEKLSKEQLDAKVQEIALSKIE